MTKLTKLPRLAEKINDHHRECEASARSAVDHAKSAGELLVEAKSYVEHGGWSRWLQEHVAVSKRTAQVYMRLARRWDELANAQQTALLPLRLCEVLKLLADTKIPTKKPPEVRSAAKPVVSEVSQELMTSIYLDEIVCGDNCDVLGDLPCDCVDLVVTSPPYDDLRTYGGHDWDFDGVACQLKRVLKPGGVIVWVVADQTKDGSETGSSFRQALHFQSLGLNLHDTIDLQDEQAAEERSEVQRLFRVYVRAFQGRAENLESENGAVPVGRFHLFADSANE